MYSPLGGHIVRGWPGYSNDCSIGQISGILDILPGMYPEVWPWTLTSAALQLVLEVVDFSVRRRMPGPFRKRAFVHHYVGEGLGVDVGF